MFWSFFCFNDTATTEIYTLSLHDALPISGLSTTQISYQYSGSESWLLEVKKKTESPVFLLLQLVKCDFHSKDHKGKSTWLTVV